MRYFYTDKRGKVVVWQNPNLPLWTWIVASVLTHLFNAGKLHALLQLIAFGALFAWAWLEIFQGASYFRRALGVVVLTYSVISRL
jgi:hypothetical protein